MFGKLGTLETSVFFSGDHGNILGWKVFQITFTEEGQGSKDHFSEIRKRCDNFAPKRIVLNTITNQLAKTHL